MSKKEQITKTLEESKEKTTQLPSKEVEERIKELVEEILKEE